MSASTTLVGSSILANRLEGTTVFPPVASTAIRDPVYAGTLTKGESTVFKKRFLLYGDWLVSEKGGGYVIRCQLQPRTGNLTVDDGATTDAGVERPPEEEQDKKKAGRVTALGVVPSPTHGAAPDDIELAALHPVRPRTGLGALTNFWPQFASRFGRHPPTSADAAASAGIAARARRDSAATADSVVTVVRAGSANDPASTDAAASAGTAATARDSAVTAIRACNADDPTRWYVLSVVPLVPNYLELASNVVCFGATYTESVAKSKVGTNEQHTFIFTGKDRSPRGLIQRYLVFQPPSTSVPSTSVEGKGKGKAPDHELERPILQVFRDGEALSLSGEVMDQPHSERVWPYPFDVGA